VYDETKPQYGFKQFWSDLFAKDKQGWARLSHVRLACSLESGLWAVLLWCVSYVYI
jgi:hypothetical protein